MCKTTNIKHRYYDYNEFNRSLGDDKESLHRFNSIIEHNWKMTNKAYSERKYDKPDGGIVMLKNRPRKVNELINEIVPIPSDAYTCYLDRNLLGLYG